MSLHLDLEEQEQVDQLKHFWKQYGNLISTGLLVVCGGMAAINGWSYWQTRQAAEASLMFDEVDKSIQTRDAARIERSLQDIREKYARTLLAQQANLLGAKALDELGKRDQAQAAVQWVAEKSSDEGYQAIARLRLAGLLLDKKAYDEALKELGQIQLSQFSGLVADRKADVLMAKGQPQEAKALYQQALKDIDADSDYRKMIEAKLQALGGDISKESKK